MNNDKFRDPWSRNNSKHFESLVKKLAKKSGITLTRANELLSQNKIQLPAERSKTENKPNRIKKQNRIVDVSNKKDDIGTSSTGPRITIK